MAGRESESMPDTDLMLGLAESCQRISFREEFLASVYPIVGNILKHEKFACGIVSMRDSNIIDYINVDFPPALLAQLGMQHGDVCPFFNFWKRKLQPVLFNFEKHSALDNRLPLDRPLLRRIGLFNVATHGVVDLSQQVATYFGFSRKEPWTEEDERVLRLVVPHLHVALSRIAGTRRAVTGGPAVGDALSAREREILSWVCMGKSNIEIASILGISFWTVKIHVRNMMKKLKVSNRSQAVAKAMTLGIIPKSGDESDEHSETAENG